MLHPPPKGPIHISKAIECLGLALGSHPMEDPVIQAWAAERQAIVHAVQDDHSVGSDAWLRRFGEVNLAKVIVGQPFPNAYVAPPPLAQRPHETRMDAANAMLLRAYPVLREAPVHFAMLEAVYGLDVREAVRFPTPKMYRDNPQLAQARRRSVRMRAWDRIQRAAKVIEKQEAERAAATAAMR
jgi:hypothetical protein